MTEPRDRADRVDRAGVSDDELDRRASAGARAVRHATMAIESPSGRDEQRRQQRQTRVLGVAVIALLVLPLLALVVVHRSAAGTENADPAPTTTTTSTPDTPTTATSDPSVDPNVGRQTVALLPGAPTDGRASKGFPVDVTPAVGLVDRQLVIVSGHGFPANTQLGVVMCTSEAAEGGGVNFCDIGTVSYVDSDAAGSFSTPYNVSRIFGTGRDCAEGNIDPAQFQAMRDGGQHPSLRQPGAWSCIIAVGAINDYDQSGGFPVTFAPGPRPAPSAPRVVTTAGPYVPGIEDHGHPRVVTPGTTAGTTPAPPGSAPTPGTTPAPPGLHCC